MAPLRRLSLIPMAVTVIGSAFAVPQADAHVPAEPTTFQLAAATGWKAVLTYQEATVRICRKNHDGWNDLLVKIDNHSEREVRRGHAWFKDLEWDTTWGDHQQSPWVGPGRSRTYAGLQTSGDLSDQRVRIQIASTHGRSTKKVVRWSIATICP